VIRLNETHDPSLKSWVPSANEPGGDFPIQNLPFGVFSTADQPSRRVGVAIGDQVFDIAAGLSLGLFDGMAREVARTCTGDSLNELMALGNASAGALRLALSRLLRVGAAPVARSCLHPLAEVQMHLPAKIGDYTDFFTSIHHASNTGRMARPDNPLFGNFKSLPVAYHGRASTIRVSGTPCIRPHGQSLPKGAKAPVFGPTSKLDFELEVGIFIGRGNALGQPIPIIDAEQHVFGLTLFNDWSARDVQAWEMPPLGPFLAKNFMSTISPWVVTTEALAPFRAAAAARGADAPELLSYLDCPANRTSGAFDLLLEASIRTAAMRERGLPAHPITRPRFADQYWTVAQMVTHHTENGCCLLPGDLLGSGTVSGPREDELGCLKELTADGTRPIELPGGERRVYMEDGDEVIFKAQCRRDGAVPIGFGECIARVVPGVAAP
jgi:fumarylacetoacetase